MRQRFRKGKNFIHNYSGIFLSPPLEPNALYHGQYFSPHSRYSSGVKQNSTLETMFSPSVAQISRFILPRSRNTKASRQRRSLKRLQVSGAVVADGTGWTVSAFFLAVRFSKSGCVSPVMPNQGHVFRRQVLSSAFVSVAFVASA